MNSAAVAAALPGNEGPPRAAVRLNAPSIHAMHHDAPITARVAHLLCESRKARRKFVSGKLLGEPGWDILLELYAAHLDGQRMSIRRLTIRTEVPATTLLRWVASLCSEGLVIRSEDPTDLRRVFVALSQSGTNAMNGYFATTGTKSVFF